MTLHGYHPRHRQVHEGEMRKRDNNDELRRLAVPIRAAPEASNHTTSILGSLFTKLKNIFSNSRSLPTQGGPNISLDKNISCIRTGTDKNKQTFSISKLFTKIRKTVSNLFHESLPTEGPASFNTGLDKNRFENLSNAQFTQLESDINQSA